MANLNSLLRVLKAEIKVLTRLRFFLELGDLLQPHKTFGRIQFLEVVGLRSLFSY